METLRHARIHLPLSLIEPRIEMRALAGAVAGAAM
jgi:hypothetical protein